MRASSSEQIASIGINEVSAAFDRLGWGTAENTRHDLGTDLFVQARDDRLFDLGLVVGVQVKSGPSYFASPTRGEPGEPEGWWFRDADTAHADHWVSHGLPHLLVLHDAEKHISYWVHVTSSVVVSTGKGVKILVPAAQTLDRDHLDDLLAVAGSARGAVPLEGTAWAGATPPATRDQLRFAMTVPRLVAPHPNASPTGVLTPPQAVAMLMQARLFEIDRYAERCPGVPRLADAGASERWAWRFVGALAGRMRDGDVNALRSVAAEAEDPASRAAATVAVACCLIEEGRAGEALAVLDAGLQPDDAFPVDDAWLRAQRARALVEVGRLEEGRREAAAVQAIRATAGHDVTATAISGVAAVLLFNTASWDQRDVREVIESADAVASWWRTQTTARGSTAIVERTFKAWAADESVTIAVSDEANDQLVAAALAAGHLGDQSAWRHLAALLARDALLRVTRHDDPAVGAEALRGLRLAGDEQAVKLAVRRFCDDGPALAATLAAATVDMQRSTRTTVFADLALLQHAGDVLDADTATRATAWLLDTLDDPSRFRELKTTRGFSISATLVEALAAVVPSVPHLGAAAAAQHVPALQGADALTEAAWVRLVHDLPVQGWSAETVGALHAAQDAVSQDLRYAILGVRSRFDGSADDELRADVRAGSLDALAELGDVRKLDAVTAEAATRTLTAAVAQVRADTRAGKLSVGGYDAARLLATVLSRHPDEAAAGGLLDFLSDDAVACASKRGVISALIVNFDAWDDATRERLREIVETVAVPSSSLDVAPFDDPDIEGEALCLSALLTAGDRRQVAFALSRLLAGPATHRRWAAHLAAAVEPETHAGALAALVADPHPRVRAMTAGRLGWLASRALGGPLAAEALRVALADPGRAPAIAAAAALAVDGPNNPVTRDALQHLATHPSASVREDALLGLANATAAPGTAAA
jgi:hypothetical protein